MYHRPSRSTIAVNSFRIAPPAFAIVRCTGRLRMALANAGISRGRRPSAACQSYTVSSASHVAGTSLTRGFKQFDGIACRVVEQDLLSAHASDNVVAEVGSRLAQRLDFAHEVGDLELYAVPAAWLGLAAIGHGLGGTPRTDGRVQQEAEVASRDDCEAGGGPELDAEAETLGVEGDCRIHIIDYVTHGDWSHRQLSLFPSNALLNRTRSLWTPSRLR